MNEFDPEEFRAMEEASARDRIAHIEAQIKAKKGLLVTGLSGALGGYVSWKLTGSWDGFAAGAILGAALATICVGIERSALHTRLEGGRTRLAIMRLRR